MKAWLSDEIDLAIQLRGARLQWFARSPVGRVRLYRTCDVQVGRWRLAVRRQRHLVGLSSLLSLENRCGGAPHAVALHATIPNRWLVIIDLDAFRDLLRRLGDI